MGIWKWVKSNIFNLIGVTPVIIGVVVAVVAWIQGIHWFVIAAFGTLLALLVIPLSFLTANQVSMWKERHKKRLTQLSNKELENTIVEWIRIPSWSVQPNQPPGDVLFSYLLKHQELPIVIERMKEDPLEIVLQSQITMNPEKTILSKADWERLSGELSIEMARLGVQWNFVGKPNTWDTVRLGEPIILDDAMTGFYFRSRVMFVVRAIILINEIWKRFLGQIRDIQVPDK